MWVERPKGMSCWSGPKIISFACACWCREIYSGVVKKARDWLLDVVCYWIFPWPAPAISPSTAAIRVVEGTVFMSLYRRIVFISSSSSSSKRDADKKKIQQRSLLMYLFTHRHKLSPPTLFPLSPPRSRPLPPHPHHTLQPTRWGCVSSGSPLGLLIWLAGGQTRQNEPDQRACLPDWLSLPACLLAS